MQKKPMPGRINEKLRLSWAEIILGVAAILLGLVLLIWPDIAATLVITVFGGICIVLGLVNVIRYCALETRQALVSNELAYGLVGIAIGVALICLREQLISLLVVFFGLAVLTGGIVKIQGALCFKRMCSRMWYLELISACISALLGALILFNPFSTAQLLMRVIGVSLVLEGIADMVSMFLFTKARNTFFFETEMHDA